MTTLRYRPESTPTGTGYRFHGPDSVWRAEPQTGYAEQARTSGRIRWDLYRLEASGWVLWGEGYPTRRAAGADAVSIDDAAIRARLAAPTVTSHVPTPSPATRTRWAAMLDVRPGDFPPADLVEAREDLERPVHTVRGVVIGPEGRPYGTTHDMDCPGCADTPFTASPRSETYWAS